MVQNPRCIVGNTLLSVSQDKKIPVEDLPSVAMRNIHSKENIRQVMFQLSVNHHFVIFLILVVAQLMLKYCILILLYYNAVVTFGVKSLIPV